MAIALVVVAGLGLWLRLGSGPIEFDLATPWLKHKAAWKKAAATPT
jgi:hypothetical protein